MQENPSTCRQASLTAHTVTVPGHVHPLAYPDCMSIHLGWVARTGVGILPSLDCVTYQCWQGISGLPSSQQMK